MAGDSKFIDSFTRRAFILGAAQGALCAALVGRLYYLQVMEGKKYLTLAEENRISFRFIIPMRGAILDRFSTPIATNKKYFRLVLIPEGVKDINTPIEKIQSTLVDVPINWEEIKQQIQKKPKFYPTVIKENLSWGEVAKIELYLANMPGVYVEEMWKRHYPYPESTSHLLGYIGKPSEETVKKDKNPYLKHPDVRVGKSGIETVYDRELIGAPGTRQVEVNARGRIVRELNRHPPIFGEKIHTTIDVKLQEKIKELLKPYKSGSVVVLDIDTGAVRAMVTSPTFDANHFTHGIDPATWQRLNEDIHRPLVNKALQGAYAPASTFKMVTALAGLSSGIVTSNTTFFCPGYTHLGSHKFHCWKRGGHGTVNLKDSIARSCDVYYYEIGKRLDMAQLTRVATQLGFGQKSGLDLPGEQEALMPSEEWKERVKNKPWVRGDTVNAAIGQGYVLATPLQMAIMIARLCSGKKIAPYVVKPKEKPPENLDQIAPQHLKLVCGAMAAAVNEAGGTGWRHKLPWADWMMGGKTGTAQVKRITMEERRQGILKSHQLPWKFRDHSLFVGFAPVHDPKYAVAVVVEHGTWGSVAAGPLGKEVLTYLKTHP